MVAISPEKCKSYVRLKEHIFKRIPFLEYVEDIEFVGNMAELYSTWWEKFKNLLMAIKLRNGAAQWSIGDNDIVQAWSRRTSDLKWGKKGNTRILRSRACYFLPNPARIRIRIRLHERGVTGRRNAIYAGEYSCVCPFYLERYGKLLEIDSD